MDKHDQYYNSPVLRQGVVASVGDESASFVYSATSFDIEFSPEYKPALQQLLSRLETGLDFNNFSTEFPAFTDHADELLKTFDRYGFVTESVMPDNQFITGNAFWKEIDAYASRYLASQQSPLAPLFSSDKVSKELLITYALQYYHFVKEGPQIIAAGMANADRPAVRQLLQGFLVSELDHDKLLLASLSAAGIDPDKVESSVPLPETFALISAFQVMADQEPLSFYGCLFLVEEERVAFNEGFVEACRQTGIGEKFFKPILQHSHINEDEDHGAITAELLQHYSAISEETRIVVLKQVRTVMDTMIAMEHAIIAQAGACAKEIGWLNK